jgi:hypothetical protein
LRPREDEIPDDPHGPDAPYYNNAGEWLVGEILEACTCGLTATMDYMVKRLWYHGQPHESRAAVAPADELLASVATHWLESAGLLEHGTSVDGAWLSKRGRWVLERIDLWDSEKEQE